jgi:hypothetical protein
VTGTVPFNTLLPVSGASGWRVTPLTGGKRAGRRGLRPCLSKVGETPVEQILLSGIGLDYPGAQLDGVGRGGYVVSPARPWTGWHRP